MSTFSVVWVRTALDQLSLIWLGASDRAAISAACARIDEQLSRNPIGAGEEVHEGLRRLVVPPLRVLYSANESDRLVEIGSVQRA